MFVNNICVSPDNRRQGIAKKMILETIENAKKQKVDFLFLQVKENNEGAVKLYKKLGFKKIYRFIGSSGIYYLNMILHI